MTLEGVISPQPKHGLSMGAHRIATGEGSYGQLVRRYGPQGAAKAVAELGAVWISHIHADHHAGLPRLLAVRLLHAEP